jgi:hypothetical protein
VAGGADGGGIDGGLFMADAAGDRLGPVAALWNE